MFLVIFLMITAACFSQLQRGDNTLYVFIMNTILISVVYYQREDETFLKLSISKPRLTYFLEYLFLNSFFFILYVVTTRYEYAIYSFIVVSLIASIPKFHIFRANKPLLSLSL